MLNAAAVQKPKGMRHASSIAKRLNVQIQWSICMSVGKIENLRLVNTNVRTVDKAVRIPKYSQDFMNFNSLDGIESPETHATIAINA